MNVRFVSDHLVRRTGFTLDIRSTSCSDVVCDETVQEVIIPGGQWLQDVLASYKTSDGNYPNNACQYWNIITDENRVHVISFYVVLTITQG